MLFPMALAVSVNSVRQNSAVSFYNFITCTICKTFFTLLLANETFSVHPEKQLLNLVTLYPVVCFTHLGISRKPWIKRRPGRFCDFKTCL